LAGFYKEKAALGGALPKANFSPVVDQISEADRIYLFDKPKIYWDEQVRLGELRPNHVAFRVNTTKDALEKLIVSGEIPQEKELEYLFEVYGEPLIKAILDKKASLGSKAFAELMDVLGLPRAFQSSWDYSMPLRQCVWLTIAHPTQSIPELGRMFRASIPLPSIGRFKPLDRFKGVVGEQYAARLNKQIFNRPNAQVYDEMGIDFVSMGKFARLGSREESFQTRLANWIPGIKQSQQAAVTYTNQMRADMADLFLAKWERQNKLYTPQDLRALGYMINIGTGRGEIGKLKDVAPLLNTVLYSTRLIASRVELPYLLVKATPLVRKEMIRDLAIATSLGVTLLSALKLSGAADVQLNPRSTDFGKIRIGNTRLDIWGGFQPYVRLMVQLAGSVAQQNMKTTAKTQYGQATYNVSGWDALTNFVRGKLSPAAGFLVDLADQKNFIGQEMDADNATVAREAWSRFTPFLVQDMVDAIKQEGLVGGTMAASSIFGTGTQSYETSLNTVKATLQEKLAQEKYGVPYAELDKADKTKYTQRNTIRDNPEMKKLNLQIKEQAAKEETKTTPTKAPSGLSVPGATPNWWGQ
jgi:hypothetical protein